MSLLGGIMGGGARAGAGAGGAATGVGSGMGAMGSAAGGAMSQAAQSAAGAAAEHMDLNAMAEGLMKYFEGQGGRNPWQDIGQGVGGIGFYQAPPQYGPMSFNQARAVPNIGPGIYGLQALVPGGRGGW